MFKIACQTDQGPRESLEDAAGGFELICFLPFVHRVAALFVTDGVGGANHGEIASKLAIRRIANYLLNVLLAMTEKMAASELAGVVAGALERANRAILEQIGLNVRLRGMSTTAVSALVMNDELHVAWAGDSRCYLYRDGQVMPLTEDHSEVARLIREGVIARTEAKSHHSAHVITNNLGRPDCTAEARSYRIMPGDLVILCTDGFTDVVSDQQAADLIRQHRDRQRPIELLPKHLVEAALRLGTLDNVTVLCCEYQPDATGISTVQHATTATYAVERAEACQAHFSEKAYV